MGRFLSLPGTGSNSRSLSFGPASVQLVVVIVGSVLGLFYLVQSNTVSTASLELRSLEAKKTAVVQDNERLSIEAARLQSIQQIKKQVEPPPAAPAPEAKPVARQVSAAAADTAPQKVPTDQDS